MDEMINTLTKGIGAQLGRPIRKDYFTQKEIILRRESWRSASEQRQQFTIDMLALSVFQRVVLVPLHGSSNFFEGVNRLGATSIAIGKDTFGIEHQKVASAAVRMFFAITKAYEIEISELNVSDIDRFIDSCLSKN